MDKGQEVHSRKVQNYQTTVKGFNEQYAFLYTDLL